MVDNAPYSVPNGWEAASSVIWDVEQLSGDIHYKVPVMNAASQLYQMQLQSSNEETIITIKLQAVWSGTKINMHIIKIIWIPIKYNVINFMMQ